MLLLLVGRFCFAILTSRTTVAMLRQGNCAKIMVFLLQAGSLELFLDNLPGLPDGVSRASDGNFWVAINSAPVPKAFGVLMSSRILRWINAWVPLASINDYGLILKVCAAFKLLCAAACASQRLLGSFLAVSRTAHRHISAGTHRTCAKAFRLSIVLLQSGLDSVSKLC